MRDRFAIIVLIVSQQGKRQKKGELSQGPHHPSTLVPRTQYGLTYSMTIAPADSKMLVTAILNIPTNVVDPNGLEVMIMWFHATW